MTFKENLLRKIEIDGLAEKAVHSLAPRGDVFRIDKQAMEKLLLAANYKKIKERELDIFVPKGEADAKIVLVLDSGLCLYKTDIKDAVMRKSPNIKEMVKLKNIIKILNDSDVLISRKEKTIDIIRKQGIGLLDFSFTKSDIDEIRLDGLASFDGNYKEGTIEALELFAQILGYEKSPAEFEMRHYNIWGKINKEEGTFGPAVIFDMMHNRLNLCRKKFKISSEKEEFKNMVKKLQKADSNAEEVFDFLRAKALVADSSLSF